MELFTYSGALQINEARIKHLDSLGLDFNDKLVYETGCGGKGDITKFLIEKGGNVTINDARLENINNNKLSNPLIKGFDTNDLNLLYDAYNVYDIIVCYGTLYHLSKPENAIKMFAKMCKEYVIISTLTDGTNSEDVNILYENAEHSNQSATGLGCRPGRMFIFKELQKNFKYVYTLTTQPDYEEFPKKFPAPMEPLFPRCIFVGSHIEMDNKFFVNYLNNNYF